MTNKKVKKVCDKGHTFYKSSECNVCPICEEKLLPVTAFLNLLAAPARRALEQNGITSLEILSAYTEKEILSLHGMGKASLPILKEALTDKKLRFATQKNG